MLAPVPFSLPPQITPSRGYCAELAVAMTVSFASALGLPVSTTHCIVGMDRLWAGSVRGEGGRVGDRYPVL